VLEEVVLGLDEDANLLWAVEQRIHGRDLPTEVPDAPPGQNGAPALGSARLHYRFNPVEGTRLYWHPYTLEVVEDRRRFVQGRLADLNQNPPGLMPEPRASLLYDPAQNAVHPDGPVHQIEPPAVPSRGLRLKRRWMLARQTNGRPRLWIQRQRLPLHAPPISGLRFDVFEEMAETIAL
jgi:hypothetical protein